MTWHAAEQYCKDFGSDTSLAEIHDEVTQSIIFMKAFEIHSGNFDDEDNMWWLGGTDIIQVQ